MKFPNIEETLRAIFGQSALGIVVFSKDGYVVQVNDNYASFNGHTRDTLLGKHFKDFIDENDVAYGAQVFSELASGKISKASNQRKIVLPDGEEKWFKTYGSVIKSHEDEIEFILGVLVDFTEEKLEHDFINIFRQLDQCLISSKDDDEVVSEMLKILLKEFNSRFISYWKNYGDNYLVHYLRVSSDEVRVLKGDDEKEEFKKISDLVERSFATNTPQCSTSTFVLPLILEGRSFGVIRIETDAIHKLQKIPQDILKGIQKRICLYLEKKEVEAKLVQKAKMASLGELSAGITHEINNPLTMVYGKSCQLESMLLSDEPVDKKLLLEKVQQVKVYSERIINIISSLKSFSKMGAKEAYSSTTVQKIISECLMIYKETFKAKNINLKITLPDTETKIFCQSMLIQGVIVNFLENAKDSILASSKPVKSIEIGAVVSDERVTFFVKDSGDGVQEKVKNTAFMPFVTTKPVKGTGLGLSISKGIVEAHNGNIWFDSSEEGATFYCNLPLK